MLITFDIFTSEENVHRRKALTKTIIKKNCWNHETLGNINDPNANDEIAFFL